MKSLENYGVLEMDAKEIRDIDGGNILRIISKGLAVLAVIHDSYCDDPDAHSLPQEGFGQAGLVHGSGGAKW